MADYFAVLSRTLAGFGEPKPELRGKLYERARLTISRQLDSHVPALDEVALAAEMDKLEAAIQKVETGFGPPNVILQPKKADSETDQSGIKDKTQEVEGKPEETRKPQKPKQETKKEEPVPEKQTKSTAKNKSKSKEASAKPPPEPAKSEVKAKETKPTKSSRKTTDPDNAADKRASEPDKTAKLDPSKTKEVPSEKPGAAKTKPVAEDEVVDPMDEWAREFLTAQEESKPEVAKALAEIQADAVSAKPGPDAAAREKRAALIAAAAVKSAEKPASAVASAPDLPAFASKPDETITIPPVPTAGSERGKGGVLKWLLIAIVALLCAGGVYTAVNWENRAEIASRLGMDGLFGGTVKPTPVKTIKITPDPEPEPVPEPTIETPAAVEADAPKSEERLTGDSQVEQPATPAPEAPATADPDTPPTSENDSGANTDAGSNSEQSANPLPAVDAGATPAVAQSAILYEEGGSPSENSFDTGRVVWSVVEEQGAEGEGKIPAIRARVEVPSRQLVLIMTIKRNTDRALPASHLIELVFAVPDDFSGGSIGEISRYVLKENEQGRGDALIGVPARIADGIFLIALNNLESAQKSNERLLRGRSWIDIPMQYRTGRRALITLEKGVPGDAVFKEVFDAWDKL